MDNDDLEIEDVMRVAEKDEIIASYPEAKPHPSVLVLGWVGRKKRRPAHVVFAADDTIENI